MEAIDEHSLAAGTLLFTRSGSPAAVPPLWTETAPALGASSPSATSTPWEAVAQADTAAGVNISTAQVGKTPMAVEGPGPQAGSFAEFFYQFFGEVPRTCRTHSLSSGLLIRADGYVVTNNHVGDGATEITGKLADGRAM